MTAYVNAALGRACAAIIAAPIRIIRIAITAAAYEGICSTLPRTRLYRRTLQRGELEASPGEAAVLDRLRAMRRPGESYSDVIVRIAGRRGAAIGCIGRRVSRIFLANRRRPASRLCRLQVGQGQPVR
jgi:hypothetical protein